eukprot:TRINITY_DN15205_c0_g1_i1.p1 TRINITY_DN15205_c0_g1~~TRINITY_DN15205_c0_g1_i1.p1  ORF type:complete len:551 (+),score=134.13 TRINITY_DN15205_c0_g1_i1:115-1653(+)
MGCCFPTRTEVEQCGPLPRSSPAAAYEKVDADLAAWDAIQRYRYEVRRLLWQRLERAARGQQEAAARGMAERFDDEEAAAVLAVAGKGLCMQLARQMLEYLPRELPPEAMPPTGAAAAVCCCAHDSGDGFALAVGEPLTVLGAPGAGLLLVRAQSGAEGAVPERCVMVGGAPTLAEAEGGALEYVTAPGSLLRFEPEHQRLALYVNGRRAHTLTSLALDQSEHAVVDPGTGWRVQLPLPGSPGAGDAPGGPLVARLAAMADSAGMSHTLPRYPPPHAPPSAAPPPAAPAEAAPAGRRLSAEQVAAAVPLPDDHSPQGPSTPAASGAAAEAAPGSGEARRASAAELPLPADSPPLDVGGSPAARCRQEGSASPGEQRRRSAAGCALPASPHASEGPRELAGVDFIAPLLPDPERAPAAARAASEADHAPCGAECAENGTAHPESAAAPGAAPGGDDSGPAKKKKVKKKKSTAGDHGVGTVANTTEPVPGAGKKRKKKKGQDTAAPERDTVAPP